MTAGMVSTPLASDMVLIELPRFPTEAERPEWVEFAGLSDERHLDGSAGMFWRRVVSTEVGDMLAFQFVSLTEGRATVSPAYWDGSGYDYELTARECRAMSRALETMDRALDRIDRATFKLAGALGDPWLTTIEAAKRLNLATYELREEIPAWGLTTVRVGTLTYVREAQLPAH